MAVQQNELWSLYRRVVLGGKLLFNLEYYRLKACSRNALETSGNLRVDEVQIRIEEVMGITGNKAES
jgi:hypothetical protein